MQTILGPFHPDLENSLAEEIAKNKTADPFCPLLVLVPSDLIRRRLKILLSRERDLALLNVQFLTFHQLALRLWEESRRAPRKLASDLFLEEALRQIIRQRQPGAEPFVGIEDRAGGCAALWQTLRDLRDGLVDAGVALDALGEGHFSRRAGERTADLLVLLRTFQEFCRSRDIADYSDLTRAAAELVPSSDFLKQFNQVFYYGFYDLTQLQLDFFHAVTRARPTTLFFPLLRAQPAHEAWTFAERFYERYVQGREDRSPAPRAPEAGLPATARLFDSVESRTYIGLPTSWNCRLTSAFGIEDEVAAAAKEILRLVDDGGMQFREIGVVARGLEPYQSAIKKIFHEHRIPLAGTFEEPLAEAPLTKTVILLLNLPAKDFLRNQVIDLLSSPYFRLQTIAGDRSQARADLWDLATRELAICKGAAEWRRLRRYGTRDIQLRPAGDDADARSIRIHAADLASLADIVETLMADLLRLPTEASWRVYAELWKELLKKYLGLAPDSQPDGRGAENGIESTILDILEQLAGLDSVADRISLADFTHTFQHWLERSAATDDRRNLDGVLALSAAAARGLSFRALFVLGMNEGVFPRAIREDAFLRDRDREVLERDLGYKVSQKLAAFDEEKLLFTLLVDAARERFHCSFQRADETGRALTPSWYIDELMRALKAGGRLWESVDIPRGIIDKATAVPFDRQGLLLPKELAIRLALTGQDPSELIDAFAPLPALYREGRRVGAALDQSGARLLAYDGMLDDPSGYWDYFFERGAAPTALESYARCPFQFFARHVLGLETLERPEEILGPSAAEFGEIGHRILNWFYQDLLDAGYFIATRAEANIDSILHNAAMRAFTDYEDNHPVGYPLAWESLKASILELLRRVIAQDLSELKRSGFAPAALETDIEGRLPVGWPEPLKDLKIRGRLDRIDRTEDRLRVIDYKFKFGAKPTSLDTDLPRAAVRGERLQPPFYYLLAERGTKAATAARPEVEADFYFIAPRWSDGPLRTSAYGSEGLAGPTGAATKETLAYLVEGVRRGRFFIHRGAHCSYCDAATICRKNHPPSLWRAENDSVGEAHHALRKKDPRDDESEFDSY